MRESRILYRRAIPQELVYRIMEAADGEGDPMMHFLLDDETVVRGDQVTHMADFCRAEFQETFNVTTRSVTDMKEEARRHESVAKFNLYCRSAEQRRRICKKLEGLPLTVVLIEEASVEINAEGVSKAVGMQALTEHLGIRMDEVMAIGDSENDRAVLQAVGFPVAMANAEEAIRELCGIVTVNDNDHNGVGEALHRYIIK